MNDANNDLTATMARSDAPKARISEKADEFYHSYETMVQVSYAELRKHGVLEAWLVSRGQTVPRGVYDWVTIGQAVALGIIKVPSEAK